MMQHAEREDEIKMSICKRKSLRAAFHERYIRRTNNTLCHLKSFGTRIGGHKFTHERSKKHVPSPTAAPHVQDSSGFLTPIDERKVFGKELLSLRRAERLLGEFAPFLPEAFNGCIIQISWFFQSDSGRLIVREPYVGGGNNMRGPIL